MFKSRINDLLTILRGETEILKTASGTKLKLTENDVKQIKRLPNQVLLVNNIPFVCLIGMILSIYSLIIQKISKVGISGNC